MAPVHVWGEGIGSRPCHLVRAGFIIMMKRNIIVNAQTSSFNKLVRSRAGFCARLSGKLPKISLEPDPFPLGLKHT